VALQNRRTAEVSVDFLARLILGIGHAEGGFVQAHDWALACGRFDGENVEAAIRRIDVT